MDLFRFDNLAQVPGIAHGISTRSGGVSQGRCESLNVSYSVGDTRENVDENIRRVSTALGSRREDLFSAYQVHGRDVTIVEPDRSAEPRPRCDVLVTSSAARTLMLRYADCTPILFVDPVQKAVAVAHAGWRGSALRTASAAVVALNRAFDSRPSDLMAGIGPAIGPCCYEVGNDVRLAFADRPWAFVHPIDGGKPRLDLWEANRQALVESGVPNENIELAGTCTRCHSAEYFSHRANGGQPAGRFAAVISLRPV